MIINWEIISMHESSHYVAVQHVFNESKILIPEKVVLNINHKNGEPLGKCCYSVNNLDFIDNTCLLYKFKEAEIFVYTAGIAADSYFYNLKWDEHGQADFIFLVNILGLSGTTEEIEKTVTWISQPEITKDIKTIAEALLNSKSGELTAIEIDMLLRLKHMEELRMLKEMVEDDQ